MLDCLKQRMYYPLPCCDTLQQGRVDILPAPFFNLERLSYVIDKDSTYKSFFDSVIKWTAETIETEFLRRLFHNNFAITPLSSTYTSSYLDCNYTEIKNGGVVFTPKQVPNIHNLQTAQITDITFYFAEDYSNVPIIIRDLSNGVQTVVYIPTVEAGIPVVLSNYTNLFPLILNKSQGYFIGAAGTYKFCKTTQKCNCGGSKDLKCNNLYAKDIVSWDNTTTVLSTTTYSGKGSSSFGIVASMDCVCDYSILMCHLAKFNLIFDSLIKWYSYKYIYEFIGTQGRFNDYIVVLLSEEKAYHIDKCNTEIHKSWEMIFSSLRKYLSNVDKCCIDCGYKVGRAINL